MALVKSTPSRFQSSSPPVAAQPASVDNRKPTTFGQGRSGPSKDTYIKLRLSSDRDVPETWFKMDTRSDGKMLFSTTYAEGAYVLVAEPDSARVSMYLKESLGNADAVDPQTRSIGLVGELSCRKRKDSPQDNPSFFLSGTYTPAGEEPITLFGNVVGAQSKQLVGSLYEAGRREWLAQRNAQPEQPAAPKTELVGGMELSF